MSRDRTKVSAVLNSYCTQRTPRFTGIQLVFKRFKHRVLFTQLTFKGLKGFVVNRALLSLHGGSLEMTLTVS